MDVNKLAGVCLLILGVVNARHEFVVRATGRGAPGFAYGFVTALFFTFGVVLLLRKSMATRRDACATFVDLVSSEIQSR